jgi:CheY-like chemotaxis protein
MNASGSGRPSSKPVSDRIAVLVVEDDPVVGNGYARELGNEGFEASTASDGAAALCIVDAATVDCVVSDIAMPGLDGLELLRRVRQKNLDLPVILGQTRPARHALTFRVFALPSLDAVGSHGGIRPGHTAYLGRF